MLDLFFFLLYLPIHLTRKFVDIWKYGDIFWTFLHLKPSKNFRNKLGKSRTNEAHFPTHFSSLSAPSSPPSPVKFHHIPLNTSSSSRDSTRGSRCCHYSGAAYHHDGPADWPLAIKPTPFCFSVNDSLPGDKFCRSLIVFETVTLLSIVIEIGQPVQKLWWWGRDWRGDRWQTTQLL